jgi:WhiB family redox-sensing transcriptional regulator
VREHGTFACYKFGPEGRDHRNGCRCAPCRAANTAYYHERKRRDVPPYVSAGPAREHIQWLSSQGVGLKQVAKESGVSQGALWKLVYGKRKPDGSQVPSKRIRPETAAAILAMTPADGAGGSRVPAGPTLEFVERLVAAGVPKVRIAERIGQTGPGLQLGSTLVTRRHARAIAAMAAELDAGTLATVRHHRNGDTVVAPPAAPEDFEPVALDDIDTLMLEMAEMLEARADQAEWRHRRACKGKPSWMFFPARGDSKTLDAAKAVCATCPVSAQCLAANLGQKVGVWGGTSENERRALRKQEAAP